MALLELDGVEGLIDSAEDIDDEAHKLSLAIEQPIIQIHNVCLVVHFHNVEFAHFAGHSPHQMHLGVSSQLLQGRVADNWHFLIDFDGWLHFLQLFCPEFIEGESLQVFQTVQ